MDNTLLKNTRPDDIPKEKPAKTTLFNTPHFIEWFMMFIITLLWVLGTHYTFLISNLMFPFFLKDLSNRNYFNLWKLIIYKIILFSLFAYLFESIFVSNIVNLFLTTFLIGTDTKMHYLAASLGITLGLFSGLKLKSIIK